MILRHAESKSEVEPQRDEPGAHWPRSRSPRRDIFALAILIVSANLSGCAHPAKTPRTSACCPLGSSLRADDEKPGVSAEPFFDPVVQKIEGWTVHVDPKLLEGEHAGEGRRAIAMLRNHLERLVVLMPEDRLAKVRKLEIWIEHDHAGINVEPGPYHPGVQWLTDRGYDPRLVKKVHITRAASLLERRHMVKHPAVVLHELAHSYHDQVLGFDEPRIRAAYDAAMKAGLYDDVLTHTGRHTRAYAATNPLEYFAEGTEAYFYRNDFYPFVRAELAEHDPVLHDLLVDIWGSLD
ncbi:MAG: metallopeptidase [Planctomycetota bacterium]